MSIVGATTMTRLNARFRGKRKPTDVLSFPAPSVFADRGLLGDLVICLPVLKRQARALDHAPARELDVLLVHGVTHLLGYDHELSEREAARQLRRERALLRGLWGKHASGAAGLIERAR